MMDQLIAIKDKILDFWNKYTAKQKTVIVCVVAAIFFALVLLGYFLTRPVYRELTTLGGDTASEFADALDSDGIDYEKESDGSGNTTFLVNESQYEDAVLVMGENKITNEGMSWDDALENDMTTSKAEKDTKATLAKQSEIRTGLLEFAGVEDATVYLNRPTDDGTIFAAEKETAVSVSFQMEKGYEMTSESASAIAYWLANAVGNQTTDNIVLTDTAGTLLYGAKEDNTLGGSVSGNADYVEKLRNTFEKNVRELLLRAGYDDVQIGSSHIMFNMDKITELVETYTTNEGQDQGLYSSSYNYKSTGSSGSGGIPGTDSNGDETDYMLSNGGTSNSETTLDKYNYLPNKTVQNIEHEVGAVQPEESSIGIVLTQYNVVKEENLEEQGLLDDISFEDYVDQNSAVTALEVPEEINQLVAAATGIAENNITVQAVQKPVYEASEQTGFFDNVTNYLMVILTVLIAALLVFVIIRGTSPVEVTELEPELSVEDLLATTQEGQDLEEIELGDKSEIRVLIEKFVDENPEAVASLLRNWINEEWGGI